MQLIISYSLLTVHAKQYTFNVLNFIIIDHISCLVKASVYAACAVPNNGELYTIMFQ